MVNFNLSDIIQKSCQIYGANGLNMTNIEPEPEHKDYGAFNFMLNNTPAKFRVAKVTPVKEGCFVALWKRDENDKSVPYGDHDPFDIVIIHVQDQNQEGQFIFTKDALIQNNILSVNGRGGKRGFRLYPSWVAPTNKQAQKTQSWQLPYFYNFNQRNDITEIKLV